MEENLEGDAPEPERDPTHAKPSLPAPRARGSYLSDVTGVDFPIGRRGYDRRAVDRYVEEISRIVVELEASRSPDAVIERALADVGEETSAILRRARSAADEIAAEANAQAQQRAADADAAARDLREEAERYLAQRKAEADQIVARANAEAERLAAQANADARDVREEADRYHDQAKADADRIAAEASAAAEKRAADADADARRTREQADRYRDEITTQTEQLVRERHRLIEDLRKLADHFHRTADRALENLAATEEPYDQGPSDRAPTEPRETGLA